MPNTLFDALLAGRMSGNGQLVYELSGEGISDEVFFDLSARFATVLLQRGVSPGDRVAAQVPKSIEALALYVACVQVGAVFLPLNTAYTESELSYFIADAEPQVLVVDNESQAMGERLVEKNHLMTLGSQSSGSLMDAAKVALAMEGAVERTEHDLAAILYTSGTTGRSKGAMLTHQNLLSNSQTLMALWQFNADDVLLHALPIFHTHGLFVASNIIMLSGGRFIFQSKFTVDGLLEAMPHATSLMGVPTFYTRLLADERFTHESAKHMRLFISGSAPLLAETHSAFEKRTGKIILERYGMTETNMNTSNPYVGARKAGTVGQALPGVELRLCDAASGELVKQGDVGLLHVRGTNVFAGYWRMPEKTKEELLPDGFFITGDLATIDEEGYVTIVGRSKDLIISGGYNIYPKEIELLIDEVPGVMESAVFGVPNDDFGESVAAVIVRDDNNTAAALSDAVILEYLAPKLARFKQPRYITFLDQLPRNAMGKVQKKILRETFKVEA